MIFLHQLIWPYDFSSLASSHDALHLLIFLNIKLTLALWNKSQLVMVCNFFPRLLDSIFQYFCWGYLLVYSEVVGLCIFFSWAAVYVCAVQVLILTTQGEVIFDRLSSQSCTKLSSLKTLALSSRVSRTSVLLTNWLHIWGSHFLLRLPEQFSELRKVLYLGL